MDNDTIYRQKAIDAMNCVTDSICAQQAIDALIGLPSAEPLTAYVISDEDGNIKCSNCGSFECWGNYCMNCGAKMGRRTG